MEVEERFWTKVNWGTDLECWPWLAATNWQGYGKFCLTFADGAHKRGAMAHRVAYELELGEIPDGMTVDHLCRNKGCVNPAHMELVTLGENVRRARAAVTHCPRGHEYTEVNTRIDKVGARNCRACAREKYHERKGAAV